MDTQCPYLNVWWIQIQNPSCSSFKLNCVDVDVSLKYGGSWQCFFLPPSAHLSLLSLFWGKTFSFYFWLCREDVWVPGRLTDIHCSQIQIGPIKHSRQKTALIKDSQQSFNVNFLLFLTDSGTLKCPWRPWNLKYIGANFNIVALAWVCSTSLWAIHRDLPRSTGNIFKASKIFIPIHVHLTQLAMAAVTGLSVLLVTFHLLMCSLFFVTVY